jgi:hypothetical protein
MTDSSGSRRKELREVLETLTPGDEIRAVAASKATGLDTGMCEEVFKALVRVGLFDRMGDGRFVRRRMIEMPER